jgi:hypothetical protein
MKTAATIRRRRSRVIAERDEIIKKELAAHCAANSFSSKTHPKKKKVEGGPKTAPSGRRGTTCRAYYILCRQAGLIHNM